MFRTTLAAFLISGMPLMADAPKVVTDIAPIHSLVAQVMKGAGEPALLMTQGADPHGFQLRPSQMRDLSQADLLIWVGPEMTPWLARAQDSASTAHMLGLLADPGTHLRAGGHDHSDEEDHDDHADNHADHNAEHADEHTDDHADDHDHTAEHDDIERPDPHAWLTPENGAHWLGLIANSLAALDAENAALYQANAARAIAELEALDTALTAQLKGAQGKGLLVYHDAHGYFTDHYGLNVLGAIRDGDAATPSASRLAEITHMISDGDVACAFAEPNQGGDILESLIDAAPVGTSVLDPSGATLPLGPDLYSALLRAEADAITTCLSAHAQ